MPAPDRPACHVCGAPSVCEIGFNADPDGRLGIPPPLRNRWRAVCASPACDAEISVRAATAAAHHGARLIRPARTYRTA